MTGLLPDIVSRAVESKSVYTASESFGVVTLVVLLVLLLEHEVLRVAYAAPARMIMLSAVIAPLSLAVILTIAARIAELIH